MDYYSLSDKAIALELGERIRSLRLQHNLTQQELAKTSLLSLNVVKALEAGKGKLSSIITVLRVLGQLDQLALFLPEINISPLQLAKTQGRVRKRASGLRNQMNKQETSEW